MSYETASTGNSFKHQINTVFVFFQYNKLNSTKYVLLRACDSQKTLFYTYIYG